MPFLGDDPNRMRSVAEIRTGNLREEILRVASRHGARSVRLFGSAARGEAGPASDLDFLVELEDGRSLFDLVHLRQDLEELLQCKVDVVDPEGLHWSIRDRILAEAVPL